MFDCVSAANFTVAVLALGRGAVAAAAEGLGEAGARDGARPARPHQPHLAPPATRAAVGAVGRVCGVSIICVIYVVYVVHEVCKTELVGD